MSAPLVTVALLADALLVAGMALYLWALAAFLHTPVIGGVQRWLRRGWRRPLIACPWCFGFWASLLLALALHGWTGRLDWVMTPLVVFTAAALVGLVGSNWTPGADDPDD